ncbi:MAG: ATP-binding domain-containing protein, partial [Leptospiraceae bacterium]|nr:ATP-binding domain-containing protein [Leptospiraceae bacterium]
SPHDSFTQTDAADDSDSDSRAASHSHTSSSTDAENADGFLSAIFPDFVRIPLTENLRNSAPIYELIRKYYHGAELKGSGPDGNPIRTVAAETDDELYHALNKTLRELIRKDRIAPNNIAILTGQDIQNSLLKDRTMVGEYNVQALTDVLQKNEPVEHTLYATIDQFKGVETPVVILIEMDALLSRGDDRSVRQVYTAITRAQVQLIVIARRKHLDRLLRGF